MINEANHMEGALGEGSRKLLRALVLVNKFEVSIKKSGRLSSKWWRERFGLDSWNWITAQVGRVLIGWERALG